MVAAAATDQDPDGSCCDRPEVRKVYVDRRSSFPARMNVNDLAATCTCCEGRSAVYGRPAIWTLMWRVRMLESQITEHEQAMHMSDDWARVESQMGPDPKLEVLRSELDWLRAWLRNSGLILEHDCK